MPANRARPAAYIRTAADQDAPCPATTPPSPTPHSSADGPTIYTEHHTALAAGQAPALNRLEAAIEAGRHDALLITEPGAAPHLMPLLHRCTRHGVTVDFPLPPLPLAQPWPRHIPAANFPPHRARRRT